MTEPVIDQAAPIFVAGHRGMVGAAIVRRLQAAGYSNLLLRTREELDLADQRATFDFLAAARPAYVFIAAARVGGINANNTRRAEFIYENLAIASNLIHGSHQAGVQRLMFLGSSCIYPRDCPQPIREEYLLTGPLEATNEPYAIAKIAGIKLCESYNDQYGRQYCSVMPTNLYGPGDNYDLQGSHVLPALIRKAHEAKLSGATELPVWGTGRPRREFLHVDDLAAACVHLMEIGHDGLPLNVGTGVDCSIAELAQLVCSVVGAEAHPTFDPEMPDGTPRKLLDIERVRATGWAPAITLADGIRDAYRDFLARPAEQASGGGSRSRDQP